MRLYVICRECQQKILIQSTAKFRYELPAYFELQCFNRHRNYYYSSDVIAETGISNAASGLIIGGIIGGLIAGPIGALSGAVFLASAGTSSDEIDKEAVERFNKG